MVVFSPFSPSRIENIEAIHLIGTHVRMSLEEDQTRSLWERLMPTLRKAAYSWEYPRYSVQVYDGLLDPRTFTLQTSFTRWAAVKAIPGVPIPEGLDTITLPSGDYAVFIHRGRPEDFPRTAQFIYGSWLPASPYKLDDRPHFECLGKGYDPADPEAEEEIWIPVKK